MNASGEFRRRVDTHAVLTHGTRAITFAAYETTAVRRASLALTFRHDPALVTAALEEWLAKGGAR